MDTNVLIAIISAASSIVIASLSYFFSKKREVEGEWRKQKLTQYRELLSSLSDCAIDSINNDEAQRRFSQAFNTIALVAPQTVIQVLLAFHDEIAFSNPNPSKERHDQLLKELVLAIRQDMKNFHRLTMRKTFNFALLVERQKRNQADAERCLVCFPFSDLPLPQNSETRFVKLLPGAFSLSDVADSFFVRPAFFPWLAHRARA